MAVRAFTLIIALFLSTQVLFSGPASAEAGQTNEASNYCDAFNRTDDAASVPKNKRFKQFAMYRDYPLKCGNGKTWGAVHIERKHNVDNWSDTGRCISETLRQGNVTLDKNALRHTWYFRPPIEWARVIEGELGIITAFTKDGGSFIRWEWCALDPR